MTLMHKFNVVKILAKLSFYGKLKMDILSDWLRFGMFCKVLSYDLADKLGTCFLKRQKITGMAARYLGPRQLSHATPV